MAVTNNAIIGEILFYFLIGVILLGGFRALIKMLAKAAEISPANTSPERTPSTVSTLTVSNPENKESIVESTVIPKPESPKIEKPLEIPKIEVKSEPEIKSIQQKNAKVINKNSIINGKKAWDFYIGSGLGPIGGVISFFRKRIASNDQVLESWSFQLMGAGHKATEVLDKIEGNIRKSDLPSLNIEKRQIAPSIFGMFNRREFLVISENRRKIKDYEMLINIREYGNNLDCSWYLTYRTPLFIAFWSRIPGVSLFMKGYNATQEIHLFDRQDLTSNLTQWHHSVIWAIEDTMLELQQPANTIDRRSRGFLFIS